MLEAFQSLREELTAKKQTEVDQTSFLASKPGTSSNNAVNLDLHPPRSSTNIQTEAMDVDYGPALPPRLVLDQQDTSDQYVATSELPPKEVSYSHKKQSHSRSRQEVDPGSASDHLNEESDEPRIPSTRPKKHSDNTWRLKFYDILEQFSFTQLVNTPTHIQGHILDALCVRDSFSWAISPKVIGGLSDHQAIIFSFIFPIRESCKFQCVPIRKIHKINISDFRMDILKFDLIRCPYKTASLLSHQYFNTLRSLLDKHAPIMKKNIPRHAETGFINCDILKAKRLKRKYERAWRRENSASNRSRYRAAINHYNFLLEKSKCNHYSNIVAENQGNPKALELFRKDLTQVLCCCSTRLHK